MLRAVIAISVQGPEEVGPRSTLNPVSFEELSVHARSIWLEETAVAERLSGGNGGAGAVGVGVGVSVGVPVGVGVGVGVAVGGTVVAVGVGVGV